MRATKIKPQITQISQKLVCNSAYTFALFELKI
jgi:hypothetical protein